MKDSQTWNQQHDQSLLHLDGADLAIDILPRLRVQTLARFRSVCKNWNELMSTQYFVDQQHEFAREGLIILLQFPEVGLFLDYSTGSLCRLPFYVKNMNFLMYGSCNGITCVRDGRRSLSYFIYNPLNNHVLELPVEESSHCDLTVAFGYITSTKQYKMVRVSSIVDEGGEMCEILTIGAIPRKWRRIGSLPNFDNGGILHPPLTVDGTVHWLRTRRRTKGCSEILSLDLETETFRRLELPGSFSEPNLKLFLLEWLTRLALVQIAELDLTVWVLEDYAVQNRRLEMAISLDALGYVNSNDFIRPLAITASGHLLVLHNLTQIYSFDFKERSLSSVLESHSGIVTSVFNYVGSMIWLS